MNTTTASKKETKKLCIHALSEGCKFGSACNAWHPTDVETAKREQAAKKTLNVCGFYPKCTSPTCTFLHVDVQPKEPQAQPPTASRRPPPSNKTPNKPPQAEKTKPKETKDAKSKAPNKAPNKAPAKTPAKPPARRGGARPTEKKEELPAFRVLHQLRGKVNAIHKTEVAYDTLATSLPGPAGEEARKKADQAREMQVEILKNLQIFAQTLDSYLDVLGAKAEDQEDDVDEEGEDETTPPTPGTPTSEDGLTLTDEHPQ